MDAEVAVIGVGTMGAMTLWALAEAGVPAIGFEQFGLAHDRAAVGGESRLFRMAYHESPEYVPLLREARRLWDELERLSGARLFTPTGCLSIGDPDSTPMRNVAASIAANDLPHEYLDTATLRRRYPQHRPRPGEVGLLDRQGGLLRPEFAVLAAAERAQRLGARLLTDTRVLEVRPEGDRVLVRAGGRGYRVRHAVLASGAWLGRWHPGLRAALTPRRLVLSWFAPYRPAEFQVGRFPAFIRDTDGVHLFGVPIMDGASVKAGFADLFGDIEDPDEFVRDVRPAELGALREVVADLLPGLRPNPIRVSVHMDGYTADRHALVGPLPGQPGVWLLGGFSGHGFKLAPVFGKIMAELLTEGRPSLPIAQFDPARALLRR